MARLLLLWALLGAPGVSGGPAARPRMSFMLGSSDRGVVHFSQSDVHNTTTLLLSGDGSTLYVGARNAILSLDVSNPKVIHLKNKVDWSPSEQDINECVKKQKNAQVDCPNFVRVLQPKNASHLYACGSYAYNPHDALLDTRTSTLTPLSTAKGRCPFNPLERSTALTVDGELFTGTTQDFRGANPVINRHFCRDGGPHIRLETSNVLLDEPTFVSSTFDKKEGKLYFFFTEVLKEFHYVEEQKGARLAQVCKDDIGGERTLQRKWTSFAKSLLLCQRPRQPPFDILQDMFVLQPPEGDLSKEMLFYGVFTSRWSLDSGASAVCRFRMEDIRDKFAGSYKSFDPTKHEWSKSPTGRTAQGKCGLGNATDLVLEAVKRSFLTYGSVGADPLLVSAGPAGAAGYSRLVAVTTHAANQKEYTVLILLTEQGLLHKVVLLESGPRVIEEVQVFTEPQVVKTLLVSSSKGVVYVGWSGGVTAVPLAHCSSYPSCSQCVLARDPFCSWDPALQACTQNHTSGAQDVENGNVTKQCPTAASVTPHTEEVQAALEEVLTLPCARPSELATLSWTAGPGGRPLHSSSFLQHPDGSLSLLVGPDTLGSYCCTSQEAGYREVRAVFTVVQRTTPKAFTPPHTHPASPAQDRTSWGTLDWTERRTQTAAAGPGLVEEEKEAPSMKGEEEQPSPEDRRGLGPAAAACGAKQYHTELVVVSLLLALCVGGGLLALVHIKTRGAQDQDSPEAASILKQGPPAPEGQGVASGEGEEKGKMNGKQMQSLVV